MKGNYFQLILTVIFIFSAIFGVLVFSGAIPIGNSNNEPGGLGTVVLWGTIPTKYLAKSIEDFNQANTDFTVKYIEKDPSAFDRDLLEALAKGTGPDMFFLSDNLVYHYSDKIFTIPYSSYPLSSFKNAFAGAGEVFLTGKGVLAFPLLIDPLMLYYNRSILDANGIVYPPATWSELMEMMPILSKKDETNKIIRPVIGLGHSSNVTNAKDILSALFLQAGNPIVSEKNGSFVSTLDSSVGNYNIPSILKFYTDFADPNSDVYSWNKSFSNSNDVFSKEDSVFYFGFASELSSLVNRNPNQDFFVAGIPQIKDSNFKATSSRVTGIAVSSFSKNLNTAILVANLMATSNFASSFSASFKIPPARRDLLATKPKDAFSPIFYNSALYAKSWLDPSPNETYEVFNKMVNAVLSGNLSISGAILDASSRINLLLK